AVVIAWRWKSWLQSREIAGLALALALVFLGSQAAFELRASWSASLAMLGAAVTAAVALFRFRATTAHDTPWITSSPALCGALAAAVFLTAMAESFVLRAAFSTQIAPDSLSYWVTPQTL